MHRRHVLLGAVCCLGLGACASWSPRSSRAPGSSSDGARPSGEARAGGMGAGAVELSVTPVARTGALAHLTGHCDVDGVVAAQGSSVLARRACERDLEVEHDLAEGLTTSLATTVHNEARDHHLAGHLEEARQGYVEALRQDAEGVAASSVTELARINLGLLHHEQGDQATAQEHLRWVLEHSTEPTVRGAAYHNLSLCLLEEEDYDGALDAASKGLALLRESLGDRHGSVGASLNTLGVIYAERDELVEAIETLEQAVEVRTEALGRLHPATAASHTNLGVALGREGRWDEALLAHQQALAIDEEVLGAEHATTAADHGHVGAALMELGRPEDARARFDEALAILEPVRPADDPEIERLRGWLRVCDEAEAVAQGTAHIPTSS